MKRTAEQLNSIRNDLNTIAEKHGVHIIASMKEADDDKRGLAPNCTYVSRDNETQFLNQEDETSS